MLFLGVLVPIDLSSKVRSGKKKRVTAKVKSKLKVKNSKVVNKSPNLNVQQLQVQIQENAVLEGLPVDFVQGGFFTGDSAQNIGSQNEFTGSYIPATDTVVVDNSSCQSLPGMVNSPMVVTGNSTLEGVANIANGLTLQDASTNLTINSQAALNSDVNLNGGTATLSSDLDFSEDYQFEGEGFIEGGGNAINLGGRDIIVTSTLYLNSDVALNSRATLYGTWTFLGDNHILGRGNVLDLSKGGSWLIRPTARLYIANLNIKGLGTGNIQFIGGDTGQLVLSSCTVELDSDYTFSNGGIYIDSTSTIITKDKHFTIDDKASMTVDGVTLWYDTTVFDDDDNIRPTVSQDPNQTHIAYLNNGVIRHIISDPGSGGDIHYTTSIVNLNGLRVYSPGQRAFFDASLLFDGHQNTVYFASNGEPVTFVADGESVFFTNVEFASYSPDMTQLGTDSEMIFGDSTTIELGGHCTVDLNITWTFRGQCVLKGYGQTLNIGPEGGIVVQGAGSSLILSNIKIAGVAGNNIRCTDDTTTLSLCNVTWSLDSDYSFTKGHFDVLTRFDVNGDAVFNYETSQQSSILYKSIMYVDMDTTFNYAPIANNRDLIYMDDVSSMLYLNGATLASSTTGLRLTTGTLIVDKVNYIDNPGAVSLSQGVEFGDGTPAGELNVSIVPGGRIEVLSGCFNIN
jgi:hypothetical protein